MIKVSVLYPASANTKFDIAYYANTHMPMVRAKLGSALRGSAVDKGLSGAAPGTAAPYHCVSHFMFDSVEAFHAAFDPQAKAIMADVPNYTNAQPVVLISETVA